MVEGQGSKTFAQARKMLQINESFSRKVLEMITESTINYLRLQIDAGAQMVQLFDSWAGILGVETYRTFSLPYLKNICDALDGTVPITVFSKGAHFSLEDLSSLKCNTIGLDWNTPPEFAREIVGNNFTLQGNLDPAVLYGNGKDIVNTTEQMLKRFGKHRHIANLGHGVYPDTNPEAVKLFIKPVKEFKHE
jgi:uroporphyrinogen decarboxylase